ncbi:MAG: TVP38/TMEM64 family protein [Halobacteriaceae archaeon]
MGLRTTINHLLSIPIFTSTRARTIALIVFTSLIAIVGLVSVFILRTIPELLDPVWLRQYIEGYGMFAPIVFILLQATQIVIAPIPGQILGFIGGYLFGTIPGVIYSLIGATIGSIIVFIFARRFGRSFIERFVIADTLSVFDTLIEKNGRFVLFVVFLVPALPDDAICAMAGITRIPIWQLVIISLVGRFPGYLMVSYAGAQFAKTNYIQTMAILFIIAVTAIVVYWYKERILSTLFEM